MEKILFNQSNGMISVIGTLLHREKKTVKRWYTHVKRGRTGTKMMLNAQVAKIQQLSRKTLKIPQTRFGQSETEVE